LLAYGINNRVDSAIAGDRFHPLKNIFRPIIDYLVGA